jgi:hypothetical protein
MLENGVFKKMSKFDEDLLKTDSKVAKLDHKIMKKIMSKINDKLTVASVHENKIREIDTKMIDFIDTMEGMVQMVRENNSQITLQISHKIESVQQDMEIFETQMNRGQIEMSNQIKDLHVKFQKLDSGVKNFIAEQINKFDTVSECDDESSSENQDFSVNQDLEVNQENMVPNRGPQLQSKAFMDLLKSQGIKVQLKEGKFGVGKSKVTNQNPKTH